MSETEITSIIGGITSASGFKATGIHAGFRRNPSRLDMALVVADESCVCAGTFTQNPFASAPVQVTREHVANGVARAIVVNSGNANAATGDAGLDIARRTCDIAASAIGCPAEEVLVASTGVIGQPLPIKPFESGIPAALSKVSTDGGPWAASAILTTDTYPKEAAVSYVSAADGFEDIKVTIGGMAKGSGMIMPNMATMIAIITTDAPLAKEAAKEAVSTVVRRTFNKVTVDGDSSTNDTCLLLASGEAARSGDLIEPGGAAYDEFVAALGQVCERLARMIAQDGEGSTKLVTVNVTGAADDSDADLAARRVANSPLVKTAIFGHDCNWGRVAVALGTSGARFEASKVNIDMMGIPVCREGLALAFDEDEALRRFEEPEVVIDCDLGAGTGTCTVWTCDLTYDYVRINGEYRT